MHPISVTPDEAFASKMYGDGVVVLPSDGHFYAPVSGTITYFAPSHHSLILEAKGTEILIHFGIDTSHLNGDGFKAFVLEGQTVKQGDLLVQVDLEYIKAMGYSSATPVVIKKGFSHIEVGSYRNVTINDDLFDVVK